MRLALSSATTVTNEELARGLSALAREREIANKLLDGREKLNEDFESSIRRWPWELLQNASDASSGPLSAEFELAEDYLEFRHNGGPFEMTNLVYLIEQTSVRERRAGSQEAVATVGKFGTGFMTTQLLSDVVQLSGVYAHRTGAKQPPQTTFQRFRLTLDRSGRTAEEVIRKINATKAELAQLDDAARCPFLSRYQSGFACDTVFRFALETDQAREAARVGLLDLSVCLPYVFAFVGNLTEVRVSQLATGVSQAYSREQFQFRRFLKLFKVRVRSNLADSQACVLCSSSGPLTFAAQVAEVEPGKWKLLKKPPSLPTVFVDFPLVGSEDWVFPGVVQSHDFEPNEKRSRVLFNHGAYAPANRNILAHLLPAFAAFCQKTADFSGLMKLLLVPHPAGMDVDRAWFDKSVRSPLRQLTLNQKVIPNSFGAPGSLLDLFFVRAESLESALDISRTFAPLRLPGVELPRLKPSHFRFFDAVFDDMLENSFGVGRKDIHSLLGHLANLKSLSEVQKALGDSEEAALAFLNKAYSFIHLPDQLLKHRVFPNQRGEFKAGTELVADCGVPEPVKDVLAKLKTSDPRRILAHSGLKLVLERTLTIEKAANFINETLKKGAPNLEVALMLTSLIPDSAMQAQVPRSAQMHQLVASIIFVPALIEISNADLNLWRESDIQVTDQLMEIVEKAEKLQGLQKILRPGMQVADFLNGLYASSNLIASRKIFLSQVDEFRCLKDLEGDRLSADLAEEGYQVQPVRELLLEVHALIGKRNLKAALLSPLVNTDKFTGVLRFFLLRGLVAEVNEFLDNDKNVREPNFRVIFDHLRTLERKFGFAKFEAYNNKKDEMTFSLCDSTTKRDVSDILSRPTAKRRLDLINRVSDEHLNVFEQLDPQRQNLMQLLQKLPSMTDLEINAILAGNPAHPDLAPHVRLWEPPGNHVLVVPMPSENAPAVVQRQLWAVNQHKFAPENAQMQEDSTQAAPLHPEAAREGQSASDRANNECHGELPHELQKEPECRLTEADMKKALKRVRQHLRGHSEYDVSKVEAFDSGLIAGATRKRIGGVPIVVAPTHNKTFRLERRDVMDELMDPDAELWVTSENSPPKRVALGAVLRKNKLDGKRVKF